MRATKFKVLTYLNHYVDEIRLYKGIYRINVPRLHPENTTIETLERDLKLMEEVMGRSKELTLSHIKNLNKCKLVEVELI